MRVLITGGAGFIGSHLVDHYIKDNNVGVIDNLITGRSANIHPHFGLRGFRFMRDDICDVTGVYGEIDLILHFASPASPFDYLKYPIETMRTASVGTYNMLELARKNGARFVLASTSEVYGDPEQHPQTEDYWGNVNPVGPRAVYDEGKRFAEALTVAYHRKYGVNTGIVRIFNTYGERMRYNDGRLIPTIIDQVVNGKNVTIFGDGTQTRSFCYIADTIRGIVALARSDYHQPINIGNSQEYTVMETAMEIQRLCGGDAMYEYCPLPEDDPRKRKPDITRAKRILGWEPEIGLIDGLTRMIKEVK